MIQAWIELARQPRYRRRVVFLEDYDIALAQELVQGVDRLDQHAAPAVGSLRHQRHEGAGERRPQLLDPRRLVGRGL